jgi:hypothetical protein
MPANINRWCIKQYLARKPGAKRQIPALAATCKLLYKDWRDLTIWVFCSELCLDNALRVLPYENVNLMTHVRLFERSNEMNLVDEKDRLWGRREAFGEGGMGHQYEVGENKQIVYRGQKVWVKEMMLVLWADDI